MMFDDALRTLGIEEDRLRVMDVAEILFESV
jgi:hypothetical protein